ncbi:MAG: hypothetical protein ABEJ82_03580 [Haloplanus sp.]
MVTVDDALVSDLSEHDEYVTARTLVETLERNHVAEGPGVPREVVDAYAEALEFDRERFDRSLAARVTEGRTWQPGDRIYEVDGNLSIYPESWHERLADTTDLVDYVEVMVESVRAPAGVEVPRDELGVVQEKLITAVEIIGGLDRNAVRGLIKKHRLDGTLVLYAFQNPEELVRLPE